MRQSSVQERAELRHKFDNALTWAVAVIIVATPMAISVRGVVGAGLIKSALAQSMILVLLAAWLVKMAVCETRPRVLPGLALAILVFICINALSLSRTSDIGNGLLKFSQLFMFASLAIMCTDIFGRREDLLKALAFAAFAGFLVSAYGIAQHFGKDFIQWETARFDIRRGPATLGNPNFAAQFLVATLPLCVTLLLTLPGFWRRVSLLICTGMMLFHIWFTNARSAIVGVTVTALVMLIALFREPLMHPTTRMRARRWAVVLALVIVLSGTLIVAANRGNPRQVFRLSDRSIAERFLTWRSAFRMIRDNPWLGTGLGDFQATIPAYWSPFDQRVFVEEGRIARKVHNDFLEMASEIGIPGLAAFLLMLSVAGVLLGREIAREKVPSSRIMMAGMGAALAGVSAQAIFTFSLQNAASALVFWTLIGLAGSVIRHGTDDYAGPASKPHIKYRALRNIPLYLLAAVCLIVAPLRFRAVGADYRIRAAQTLLERDKFEKAAEQLERAISLDPLNFDALFKRSLAATALGQHEKAERGYRRCLQLRPNDSFTMINLGFERRRADRLLEAQSLFETALSLAPNDRVARRALASCYVGQGKLREAIGELETAQHYDPRDRAISLALARCYRNAGLEEDAITQYEKTLAVDPSNAAARLDLGLLYLANGNYARATELLEQALALRADAIEAHAALAQVYVTSGELLEAALHCSDYLMGGGTNRDRARSLVAQIDATLLTVQGRLENDIVDRTRFVLARILLALNDGERALRQLKQIEGQRDSILFRTAVTQTIAQLERIVPKTTSERFDAKR